MNKISKSERGQALIIFAASIIGLIAIVGLAVDGGMAFSERRHAQNAADTAAVAGSLARVNENPNWTNAARDLADENGYSGDLVNNEVEVFACTDADATCVLPAGANPDDYVQVVITTWFDTAFARVIGIPQIENRVQAIALADTDDSGPLGNGEAIVALSPECQSPDNFIVNGNPKLTITGGGLFVNTENPSCGFKCESSSAIINANVTTAGGTIDNTNCTESIKGTKSTSGSLIDFPITLDDIGLDVPPECTSPLGTYVNYGKGKYPGYPDTAVSVLTPGIYSQFPPNKANDTMILQPGVYCITDNVSITKSGINLIGHDVTLFIRAGYDFNFNGGIVDIDAPNTGDYAGYLIIVEPDYSAAKPEACDINGNTLNDYTGTIFAPYCACKLNGGSKPTAFNAQLLCYTVLIDGKSEINFTYDPGENGEKIDPPKIGIIR